MKLTGSSKGASIRSYSAMRTQYVWNPIKCVTGQLTVKTAWTNQKGCAGNSRTLLIYDTHPIYWRYNNNWLKSITDWDIDGGPTDRLTVHKENYSLGLTFHTNDGWVKWVTKQDLGIRWKMKVSQTKFELVTYRSEADCVTGRPSHYFLLSTLLWHNRCWLKTMVAGLIHSYRLRQCT